MDYARLAWLQFLDAVIRERDRVRTLLRRCFIVLGAQIYEKINVNTAARDTAIHTTSYQSLSIVMNAKKSSMLETFITMTDYKKRKEIYEHVVPPKSDSSPATGFR